MRNNQQLGCIWRRFALLAFMALWGAASLCAQTGKSSLPDPVKFLNKFETVANVVDSVFDDMGFKIELEDRKGGRIVTRPYEFITGALTSSEVEKIARKNDTATGIWLKGRYSIEALLEIVSPTQTMVTIRTKIEALNRDVDGSEEWVVLDSLGSIERRILGKISAKLMMGAETPPEEKKGFWDKSPQPVDPRQRRFPTTPSR